LACSVQVERPVALLLDGHVVDVPKGAQPVGGGVDPLHQVRLLQLALHDQHQVDIRQPPRHRLLDLLRQRLRALHREGSAGCHPSIAEQAPARSPDPHRPHLADALHGRDRRSQPGLGAGGGAVHQLVPRVAEDLDGRHRDQARYQERRDRVGPRVAVTDPDQPGQDADRGKHVGDTVLGVGREGIAAGRPSRPAQHHRPSPLDQHRGDDHGQRVIRGGDTAGVASQPPDRLQRDAAGG